MKSKNLKQKGFTLVELLVVIAIIAILAAVVAPNAFKAIEKSKVSAAESDYKAIKTAVLSYYSDTGIWPETDSDTPSVNEEVLFVTGKKGNNTTSVATGWNGPYMEKWKGTNPWGGTYTLKTSGNTVHIELTNVPKSAQNKLEQDLDGNDEIDENGIVRSTDDDGTIDIYITQ